MAETRPDPEVALDRDAIDRHARKLVAEKAARDRARFEGLQRRPLSLVETLVIAAAVAALVAVTALALVAQK